MRQDKTRQVKTRHDTTRHNTRQDKEDTSYVCVNNVLSIFATYQSTRPDCDYILSITQYRIVYDRSQKD